jgi:hypothetical protein
MTTGAQVRGSRRRRRTSLTLAVAALALTAMAASRPALAAISPICTRGPTTVARDPRGLLPLTSDSIGPSAAAALAAERAAAKPQVVSAILAIADHERGPEARFECGARVWRLTVVVYITLRAFKQSASLSQRVDFVGRFANGYHVWQVVH